MVPELSESNVSAKESVRARSRLLRAAGGKFGSLLGALIALLLTVPLIVRGWAWNLAFGLFASTVLVASLQAARSGRRTLTIGLTLAIVDLAFGRLVYLDGARWLVILQAMLWLSTLLFVTVVILDAVFERDSVDVDTLQAALCVYLLLGLIWVYLYAVIALVAPGSFSNLGRPLNSWSDDPSRRAEFLQLFVFSYSTLTSLGYDDLKPTNGFTNMCACLEALSGQVYLAVVIARLVGMQIGPSANQPGPEPGERSQPPSSEG